MKTDVRSVKWVDKGDIVPTMVEGGVIRKEAPAAGLLVETDEQWIFVPKGLIPRKVRVK